MAMENCNEIEKIAGFFHPDAHGVTNWRKIIIMWMWMWIWNHKIYEYLLV